MGFRRNCTDLPSYLLISILNILTTLYPYQTFKLLRHALLISLLNILTTLNPYQIPILPGLIRPFKMSSSLPQKLPGLDQDLPKLIPISIYTEKQLAQLIISNTTNAQILTDPVKSIILLSSCVPDRTEYMNAPLLQGKSKHIDRNYPKRRERKHCIIFNHNAVFSHAEKNNLVLIITLVTVNMHILSDPAYYIYFLCSLSPDRTNYMNAPLLRGKFTTMYFHSKTTAAISKLGARLNFKKSDDFCEFSDKIRSFGTSYYAICFYQQTCNIRNILLLYMNVPLLREKLINLDSKHSGLYVRQKYINRAFTKIGNILLIVKCTEYNCEAYFNFCPNFNNSLSTAAFTTGMLERDAFNNLYYTLFPVP